MFSSKEMLSSKGSFTMCVCFYVIANMPVNYWFTLHSISRDMQAAESCRDLTARIASQRHAHSAAQRTLRTGVSQESFKIKSIMLWQEENDDRYIAASSPRFGRIYLQNDAVKRKQYCTKLYILALISSKFECAEACSIQPGDRLWEIRFRSVSFRVLHRPVLTTLAARSITWPNLGKHAPLSTCIFHPVLCRYYWFFDVGVRKPILRYIRSFCPWVLNEQWGQET
jgi:hypothetical protein